MNTAMTANTVDFMSCNDNLPGYWDEWYHDSLNDFKPPTAITSPSIQSSLPVDPTLQAMMSSAAFVSPDCLQSFPTPSPSPSPASIRDSDSALVPAANNKRRKESRSIKSLPRFKHEQDDVPDAGARRKSVSEPVRRERNRTAAAKCRAKSKLAEEDLKESQRIERERNKALRAAFDELSNETLLLKHELLSHSGCNHPVIDQYLMHAADQISRGLDQSWRAPQSMAETGE